MYHDREVKMIGLGTQSIAAFAEKNRAYLRYKDTDGWFSLRLIL